MRMTVFQPSSVYPVPTRADSGWQVLHCASTSALPVWATSWVHAGSANDASVHAMNVLWMRNCGSSCGGNQWGAHRMTPARIGKLRDASEEETVKSWIAAALLALFSSLFSYLSFGQGFPERPIRIIVPLPPGGSPDTIARAIAQGLQGVWSQPVVVENR